MATLAESVTKDGSAFQTRAPATGKARSPILILRVGGTTMGGATGGCGGSMSPHFWDQRGTGGYRGRSNENDLCFYTADSLYSVGLQVFLNMTYILSFALHRYNCQCLALHLSLSVQMLDMPTPRLW